MTSGRTVCCAWPLRESALHRPTENVPGFPVTLPGDGLVRTGTGRVFAGWPPPVARVGSVELRADPTGDADLGVIRVGLAVDTGTEVTG